MERVTISGYCPECGAYVSETKTNCTECGAPMTATEQSPDTSDDLKGCSLYFSKFFSAILSAMGLGVLGSIVPGVGNVVGAIFGFFVGWITNPLAGN